MRKTSSLANKAKKKGPRNARTPCSLINAVFNYVNPVAKKGKEKRRTDLFDIWDNSALELELAFLKKGIYMRGKDTE